MISNGLISRVSLWSLWTIVPSCKPRATVEGNLQQLFHIILELSLQWSLQNTGIKIHLVRAFAPRMHWRKTYIRFSQANPRSTVGFEAFTYPLAVDRQETTSSHCLLKPQTIVLWVFRPAYSESLEILKSKSWLSDPTLEEWSCIRLTRLTVDCNHNQ